MLTNVNCEGRKQNLHHLDKLAKCSVTLRLMFNFRKLTCSQIVGAQIDTENWRFYLGKKIKINTGNNLCKREFIRDNCIAVSTGK